MSEIAEEWKAAPSPSLAHEVPSIIDAALTAHGDAGRSLIDRSAEE
jgi:hypothetical protein